MDWNEKQKEIREAILADMEKNNVRRGGFQKPAIRKGTRRAKLEGEYLQLRINGGFLVERWAKHGVTLDMLRAGYMEGRILIYPDRHRQPFVARVTR
jgi:hypothetical protein